MSALENEREYQRKVAAELLDAQRDKLIRLEDIIESEYLRAIRNRQAREKQLGLSDMFEEITDSRWSYWQGQIETLEEVMNRHDPGTSWAWNVLEREGLLTI